MKIAILTIATNKYISLLPKLIDSIEKKIKFEDVTLFVFTDSDDKHLSNKIKVINHKITHVPHPLGTMMRYNYYMELEEILRNYDYIYHLDCDMIVNAEIGEEILSERVVVLHPGFYENKNPHTFTYDRNSSSNAFVSYSESLMGVRYYQNCFQGGSSTEFINMSNKIIKWIEEDLRKNIIVLWHDESYMNRYMINNKPTLELNPGYAYPEKWNIPFEKKIIHLEKKHTEIRSF